MHYYPTGYAHCRTGSDSSGISHGVRARDRDRDRDRERDRDLDPTDSGESTLSDVDALTWFERVSMIVILLNCVTLGMYQPCMDDKCETNRCKILQMFDDFIFAFFTLEMTIKMIAMGVWGTGSYLADSWNRLDLFIVLAGAVEYCLNVENMNLSAIRTIRVLRPLRAINRIPSMRILVMLLLDTLPMLGNVLLLCFFVFFIFGIVGVQLWQGILRQRCYFSGASNITFPQDLTEEFVMRVPVTDMSHYYTISQEQEYICSKRDHSGMHQCADLPNYKVDDMTCNLTYDQAQEPGRKGCINWNQYYTSCLEGGSNPFQGTISFDNIGLAWVAIFLVISLEGWTDIMYYVQDAHSFWDWIYFVLLIVIGSFFMINLCLVVIATQFSETKKREMERMRLERARFQSTSTLASSTNNSEPTTCYAEIVKYIAHLWRRTKRRLCKKIRLLRYRREQRREQKMHAGETLRLNLNHRHHPCCPRLKQLQQQQQQQEQQQQQQPPSQQPQHQQAEASKGNPSTPDEDTTSLQKRPGLIRVASLSNQDINNESPTNLLSPPSAQLYRRRSSVMFSNVILLHGEENPPPNTNSSSNLLVPVNTLDKRNVCSSEKMTQTGDGNIWQITSVPNPETTIQSELLTNEAMTCQELLALGAINATVPTGQIALDSFFGTLTKGRTTNDDYVQLHDDDLTCCQDIWRNSEKRTTSTTTSYGCVCATTRRTAKVCRAVRRCVKSVTEHRYFQQGILLAILINTLSMGIEYHKQPEELTAIVETSNIVFSAIFAVEMLLKVIAEGPFGYIANGFNVFDGIIVILSAVEICQKFLGESHMDSGLSVLRTFRLLRILKLVRFMPNLRRQLFVMLRTMDNVAIFFSLLILFIFIFSILGMYLFGGKFCKYTDDEGISRECTCHMIITKDKRCECDRKHFNNVLWATVTVFQILTQEDWNMVLSNGMAKTSHWAALYFVALMTFGNYVLFNLLVAILVEGFSAERNERREREQRELARKMSCMIEAMKMANADDGSRSLTSSSDSCIQEEVRNGWRSAEELRKYKDTAESRDAFGGCQQCECRESSKEHHRKGLDHHTLSDPKCNIQKESYMLKQPFRQVSPPVITHTAATPLDSPNTTLDDCTEFRYSISAPTDSNKSSSTCTLPTLLKPPSFTPPPLSSRPFEKFPDESKSTEKISSVSSSKQELADTQDKHKIHRGYSSWRLPSRSSLRKKKCLSGSDSDAVPLNNGRDHSQCNGGGVTRHLSLRNDILLQPSIRIRNDTQRDVPNNRTNKTVSPQESFRNRANTNSPVPQLCWTPSVARQSSLSSHIIPLEPKSMNTNKGSLEKATLPKIHLDEIVAPAKPAKKASKIKRFILYIEPKNYMKERDDFSLYLFPPNNRFRQFCQLLVEKKWFDNVVLLFIALNCITLAMERPNIPPYSTERIFLSATNYIFTVVFAVEMFVKVVAWGMCYGPDAYFTSGWNIMDGSLVIISIVDLLMSVVSESSPRIFGILRVFRLLRSLRPLRVINRAPGLKLVVQTLLSSLRPIGNIVLICCTFFIIFGILGVQLFKGAFYYCKGENSRGVRNRTECIERGDLWVNQKYNFDDLGKALMSLFVLSSRDGWVNIMYTGLDAVGEDQQPQVNYSEWRLLYFISFILLVGFFVLNMFVGVVVENFHRCREEQEKEERIRRAAKRALQMEKKRRRMNAPPYYINYARWRMYIHGIVTSKYFDLAIAAVIGLNVVTMATESYKMPEVLNHILKIFNYFFTAVFIIEGAMKLIALGFLLYLKDKWNQLDVAIVILSVVGIVLEELKSKIIPINPTVLRVMRVMRIARVLKLLKMAKGIRALLDTVMQALPQVGNLGLLFFLLFFIFAALGVELFGRLECSDNHPCQGLGEHAHFANFGMAFLTLFRVATGDNWNGIMKDTLRDDCDEAADCVRNCCVSAVIAPIFFVIFVLMAQFVLVNVVVAVLMKHLEESHKHLEDEQDIDTQLEREFQEQKQEKSQLNETTEPRKPLTKVLSLPSNFTYHSPGSKRPSLHARRPVTLSQLDDIKNIDESLSDICNVQELAHYRATETNDRNRLQVQTSFDEERPTKTTTPTTPTARHLFARQCSFDICEKKLRMRREDSQESVQRIICERRKLDENLRDVDQSDMFDVVPQDEGN